MSGHYRELADRRQEIVAVMAIEEQSSRRRCPVGLQLLTRELDDLAQRGGKELSGQVAFKLYDTHGFPVELTEEVARERGFTIDRAGFEDAMQRQQEQARSLEAFARKREEDAWTQLVATLPSTNFIGHTTLEGSSEILALLAEGKPVESVEAPENAVIVLAETPFYAEAGGQVGDQGVIVGPTGTLQVLDTKRPVPGLIAHYGKMTSGTLQVGETVRGEVARQRRLAVMRNHSATHLLHRALKDVLGDHVHQQGSLVAPDRLRFDFNLQRPVSAGELKEIDQRVNELVLSNQKVVTEIKPYREALASGAMALFSEKYGDMVRVVTMGPSRELCGVPTLGRPERSECI